MGALPTWLIVTVLILFVVAGIAAAIMMFRDRSLTLDENGGHDYDGKP